MLNLGWMLGRAMDHHPGILLGNGKRNLALEIEMLLSADPYRTRDLQRRIGDGFGSIAAAEFVSWQHIVSPLIERVLDGHCRQFGRDLDPCEARRVAGGIAALRNDSKDDLTVEYDLALGEDWVIACNRAAIIEAWNVARRQNRDNARKRLHRFEIGRNDPALGARNGVTRRKMKRAFRFTDVVDIDGRPAHMELGAVMRQRESDSVGDEGLEPRPHGHQAP
jgi:hypothetical protein